MAETPLAISIKTRDILLQVIKNYWETFDKQGWRDRLLYNDLVYYRELLGHQQFHQNIKDDRLKTSSMKPLELPIVQPQIDTLVSQLSDIFLQGTPVFSFIADPIHQHTISALNALQRKHETLSRRKLELVQYIKDTCKYNYAAAECDWKSTQQPVYNNNIQGVNYGSVIYENLSYNQITRLDLYNCFFDEVCQFTDLANYGEFFGFHKIMTKTELRMRLGELPPTATSHFKKAYESPFDSNLYHIPQIVFSLPQLHKKDFNWESHFGYLAPNAGKEGIKYNSLYVLTTCYLRATYEDLSIPGTDRTRMRIFKVLVVNNSYVVYAEEITAAHGLMPIATSRLLDDGLRHENKSLVENLEAVQSLVTQLHTARIADLARGLADRAVYDPLMIDTNKVNDPSPTAKIPLKPYGSQARAINQAYFPIPYRNDTAGNLISETNIVSRQGEEIAGLNTVQRGGFVKGNKTLGEFQTVMGNAQDRAIVHALIQEALGWFTMKEITKSNILQYQAPAKIYDPQARQETEVNPSNIRKLIFEFQVADGLEPVSKFTSPEILTAALQFMSASPQMQTEYDMTKLFSYIFSTRGQVDLEKFRREQAFIPPGQESPQGQPSQQVPSGQSVG